MPNLCNGLRCHAAGHSLATYADRRHKTGSGPVCGEQRKELHIVNTWTLLLHATIIRVCQTSSTIPQPRDRDLLHVQGGSNMTGTDLCVNKPYCAAAVRPSESEATTSTLPPARVRTCSVLSGSC